MNPKLLKIYSRIPFPLRGMAASAWGYYLRSWRYGRETEKLVKEALARESWTSKEWHVWQQKKLLEVLREAVTHVPYYRDYWKQRKGSGENAVWEKLENWPILTKEIIRQNPSAFLSEKSSHKKLYKENTGGTTGTPLNLWFEKSAVREWYALFEARWRRWNGVSLADRWAIIGGQQIAAGRTKPPFWVWNSAFQQLYVSSYHLFPEVVCECLNVMKRREIRYLMGYSSAIHFLALEIIRQQIVPPSLKVILTNAEALLPEQRMTIEKAFQCPVRETYGMSEAVAAASECSHHRLHLWPEAGYLEVVDGKGVKTEPGVTGDFVCTGFINGAMPLIRYAVGDRGSLSQGTSDGCACGRGLPLLGSLEGRTHDLVTLKDGRQVWYFPTIYLGLPIREAQVIQEEFDVFRILLSSERPLREAEEKLLLERFQARTGTTDVKIEYCTLIPREKNGKFRAVISRVKDSGRGTSGAPA